ncbi:hypothetical protein C0J52_08863 [Blattella germanica]|nr:hypothetical protein C0J52_08863 [Blattella germanica]
MWAKRFICWNLCVVFVINIYFADSTPASPHIHSHHHQEREEDGGYSPKDKNHIVDGEHHSEFDHEAILGSIKQAEEFDRLDPAEAKKRLRILLSKMDIDKDQNRNKDGSLNKHEFLMFSHPEEHPDMLPVILKQTLSEKDADGDGFINFQEFTGERAKQRDKEWLIVEKEKFDSEFDKDKDGKLDGAEILSWVVPSNDEIAEDEVAHLFSSSDDDNDGVLTFDEVLEHHETFVGSEATDYGDHLHNIHIFQDEL